jgi:hypothetical protein
LDRLVAAYPSFLAKADAEFLYWNDGTKMPISDGRPDKTFDERLKDPSLADQMDLIYPKGTLEEPPSPKADPGRFRNVAFFNKMYGDCAQNETQKTLVVVNWLPRSTNSKLKVTSVNGIAGHLRAVSDEIDRLPLKLKRFAFPSAGTFNCRGVKDTGNKSMHAWGAAIDINTTFSDYWLWSKDKKYRNRIPMEIVAIFERHGFIWGGKWDHFDTMHFEYRPELFRNDVE